MSSMRVSLWAISAGDERALNHWWRIKNVGDGQKKRAYCYYTVRPVRFIAIQLLIVLPAHPWKLFRTAIHFPTIRRIVQLSSWRFILHHPDAVPQSSWPACYPNRLSISVLEVSLTSSWSILGQHPVAHPLSLFLSVSFTSSWSNIILMCPAPTVFPSGETNIAYS